MMLRDAEADFVVNRFFCQAGNSYEFSRQRTRHANLRNLSWHPHFGAWVVRGPSKWCNAKGDPVTFSILLVRLQAERTAQLQPDTRAILDNYQAFTPMFMPL
eukprot:169280-Pelagomonas_calceolata.AAC.2